MDHGLTELDVLERLLDLFLERGLEVEFVHGVQGHNWVQQVIGIETLGAYLFFALKAEQNEVLNMLTTFVTHFNSVIRIFLLLGLSFLLHDIVLRYLLILLNLIVKVNILR